MAVRFWGSDAPVLDPLEVNVPLHARRSLWAHEVHRGLPAVAHGQMEAPRVRLAAEVGPKRKIRSKIKMVVVILRTHLPRSSSLSQCK